jgi:hypothetical protein
MTLKRKVPLLRVNRERRAREWERSYGSEERVSWVRSLPCSVPGCNRRMSENAHVSPEGDPSGMGRKGDARQIIPLCAPHHMEFHRAGQRTFNDTHRIDVDLIAAAIAYRWLASQEEA